MFLNIEKEIKHIIEEKLNEKPTLDYKVEEYNLSTENKWEVLKDTIAMLNSEEAVNKNKYIILGVADQEYYIKGLSKEMRDDNEYQNLFDNINPRPHIETGTVNIDGKNIGYIFINKTNRERPYTIGHSNEKYSEGTSFIRRGSVNRFLDNVTRERMILEKIIENPEGHGLYRDINEKNSLKSLLKYADNSFVGDVEFNPSNNNGVFSIGEGNYKFNLKFDVANVGVARIYNDYDLQVAVDKGAASKFDKFNMKEISILDYTSRFRRCTAEDLAIAVNKFGKYILLTFTKIDSESHGADKDLIEFRWKIETRI